MSLLDLIIGGALSLAGSALTHSWQFKASEKKEIENIRCTLNALCFEMEACLERYYISAGYLIEKLNETQIYEGIYSAKQNYFLIYDNNAAVLGHKYCKDFSKKITSTYIEMKSLIDQLELHSYFITQRNMTVLVESTTYIKNLHKKLTSEIPLLIKEIRAKT